MPASTRTSVSATTVWSPLASGLLTGKYNDGIPPGSRATVKGYERLAERLTDPGKLAVVRRLAPIAARPRLQRLRQFALAWCSRTARVDRDHGGGAASGRCTKPAGSRCLPKIDGTVIERVERRSPGDAGDDMDE